VRAVPGLLAAGCLYLVSLTPQTPLHAAQLTPTQSIQSFDESLEMVRDLLKGSRFTEAGNVARALLARVQSARGPDAIEVAEVLDLLSQASRRKPAQGEDPDALAERALAIKERVLGSDHPEVATSLMNVGVGQALGGNLSRARATIERALAIREASFGPNSPLVASSLESLAGVLMQLQDDDGAKNAIERVLRIRETNNGADAPETVRTLLNAGIYYAQTNDFAGASAHFDHARALEQNSSHEDPLLTFSSLTCLAIAAGLGGQYAEAARWDNELLKRLDSAFGRSDPRLRFPLDSLAQDLRDVGDYSGAQAAAERSLAISERTFGPNHPAVAKSLHTLATVVAEAGDDARAIQLLERAARLSESQPIDSTAGPLWALSDLFRASGVTSVDAQFFANLVTFRESRYGSARVAVGDALGDLAAVLSTDDDYRRARPDFEQALAAEEKSLGVDHPDVATIAINLANVVAGAGDDATAIPLYQRALGIREKALGPAHSKVAAVLSNLGRSELNAAQYSESRGHLERALAIQREKLGLDHPDVAVTLTSLAELEARTGATTEALQTATDAESISREHVRLTTRVLAERQALAYAASRASTIDLMLTLAARRPEDGRTAAAVWDGVIRSRGLVLDEMASRRRSAIGASDHEIAALAEALAAARQRLAALVVRGVRDDPPGRYRRLLEQARKDKDVAELDLAAKSARFREDRSRSELGLADVSAALPADGALVAFVRYRPFDFAGGSLDTASHQRREPSYIAFVARGADRIPAVIPLGTADRIDRLIFRWRQQIDQQAAAPGWASKEAEASYRRVARELRRQVWDPVAVHLSNVSRVFVVTDGALHLVSFAALPTGAAQYLVESGPLIHYLTVERDIVPAGPRSGRGDGLLALGDPAFDIAGVAAAAAPVAFRGDRAGCGDFHSMHFGSLPASLKEVDRVVALWQGPDAARLTGTEASASAFKAEASRRSVLHLATHAFFLGGHCASGLDPTVLAGADAPAKVARENPLLMSGLALAGANRRESVGPGEDDGILTAEEITSLDLSAVQWAVLSACDTGSGEIRAGEGVFGLQRAFQIAGVRTVIMSLWAVADSATQEWMTALYRRRLRDRLMTADAVHAASVEMLHRRRAAGQSTHPFYWAGFVAAGDWR
jgi:CHAT domain-containing protein/Tfp pilus assembly protein PilF